ncbi:MAG TPA: hypothetical protein VG295_03435, partial [Solirubrobacteraceae bacterium]|nr:hypothetical protein [Solirubrobacteraceae bacterium]
MRKLGILATAVASAVVGAAPAYGATWTTAATVSPVGLADSSLTAVSCVSSTSCMAVGTADGGPGNSLSSPPNIGSFAESWNGSAWTLVPTASSAGPSAGLNSVSCPSAVFCVAVGETHSTGRIGLGNLAAYGAMRALVEMWDGVGWTVVPSPGAGLRASGLFSVSCTSSQFCIAVGEHGEAELAEIWNGTSWRLQSTPTVTKTGTWPMAISCLAAAVCEEVGGYNTNMRTGVAVGEPLAERWDGHRWSAQHAPGYGLYFPELTGVSCLSRSFCLATGVHHLGNGSIVASPFVERWDGRRWSRATVGLPKASPLNGVSCFTATDCLAVGQYDNQLVPAAGTTEPLVESWDGTRWARVAIPGAPGLVGMYQGFINNNPALFGISCVPHAGCLAVGAQASGTDSVTLAQSDFGSPGAAPAAALTQASPASASVADGAGYSGQLTTAGAVGAVTYSERGSAASLQVVVSPAGAITAAGGLAPGSYTVSGGDSDAAGDVGTWRFTLDVFTAGGLPPAGTPVFGVSATVAPVSGVVLVRLPGARSFVSLGAGSTLPLGSVVDTTNGTVRVTAAVGSGARTQSSLFYSGAFRLTQRRARSGVLGGKRVGLTVLTLTGAGMARCTAATTAAKHPKHRGLWGNGKGSFQTVGTNASATVRGTQWLTEDTCAGTLIRVARGVVSVDDFPHHRTFLL